MDYTYKRQNAFAQANESERKRIFEYCEDYKKYLDCAKTEREAVTETIKLIEKCGYKPYVLGDRIEKGDKLYYNNRGKGLFILRAGKADIAKNGIRILVAHVDSPRLDLKQVPLYESNDIAYLKTHYYGGIKKYQWLTVPLALHGVVVLKTGKKITVNIGEAPTDPVFYITDLLPHLSQEYNDKKIGDGFSAENLNLVFGGIPASGETSGAVKKGVLAILHDKYGMTEEDFVSAELSAVPVDKARDVGIDRAFITAYGHDDSVCVYPEVTATMETDTDQTVLTILADKEEIGSEGDTGMQCTLIADIINEIATNYGANPAVVRANSMCLSADVTSAYDPSFASAFEENNISRLGYGVSLGKYKGARGKSGSNDASAELVGYMRGVLDGAGVIWQTGELGRIDLGGSGTVAKFISRINIPTVDIGVPVLSMHAPYELVNKADIYSAYKAFKAFIK